MFLLLLFACTSSTPAQTPRLASAGKGNAAQQTQPASATYGDTLKMLKTWGDSHPPKNDDLARLFAMGDVRASDLQAACGSEDDKIASAAFFVLQLLGRSECVDCGNSISRKRKGLAFACEPNLVDADSRRIEKWLREKRTQTGYDCGDDSELRAPLDDSLVYALILDGSPRSKSILDHLLAMDKACAWENAISEPLEQAQSLIEVAKEVGHNLQFQPGTLGNVIRASAFFLPPEHRKESVAKVVARNKKGDRILLEVRYICGLS